jgi:chloramphenicol O-acetyltransferase
MIGSKSDLINHILNRQWTFAEVMKIETILYELIELVSFDINFVVDYLGKTDSILEEFRVAIIGDMKREVVKELENAVIVLDRDTEQVSYADYQMDEILQEFVSEDESKIPSKEELKEQIRKDTKMVSNNEVPEVQSDSN